MSFINDKTHYLSNEINQHSERLFHSILMKINSPKVAKQFILEELEAANLASQDGNNPTSKSLKAFVLNSGFSANEFNGAMVNSFEDVDGVGGPQQTLLFSLMSLGLDKSKIALIRIEVVKRIIERFKEEI